VLNQSVNRIVSYWGGFLVQVVLYVVVLLSSEEIFYTKQNWWYSCKQSMFSTKINHKYCQRVLYFKLLSCCKESLQILLGKTCVYLIRLLLFSFFFWIGLLPGSKKKTERSCESQRKKKEKRVGCLVFERINLRKWRLSCVWKNQFKEMKKSSHKNSYASN
jgi:hypothetical protein